MKDFVNISLCLLVLTCFVSSTGISQSNKQLESVQIIEKDLQKVDLGHYTGSLFLHAMSEYALLEGKEERLAQTIELLTKFGTKETEGRGNFISYEAGGSGAAYLVWKGLAPTLRPQVHEAAKRMLANQKSSPEGLMTSKHAKDSLEQIFIDVAFAVSPFLLYAGLESNDSGYIDFSAFEVLGLGIILEKELLPKKYRKKFLKGLKAYENYIESDGSVRHTCIGCLSPDKGTKADYKNCK